MAGLAAVRVAHVNLSANSLMGAMEALTEVARQSARDALLLRPEALEHRVAAQSHLVLQCRAKLANIPESLTDEERARIRALAEQCRQAMKVYRGVVRAGVRSTSAMVRTAASMGEGASSAFGAFEG